jgi:hypothetical protein
MGTARTRNPDSTPALVAGLAVGLLLAGLLVGYEPVGGDPDRIYRPIKAELARALREGRLPFWSDRLGLGVPLVAESHAAAFYPPNWLLYRALDVSLAYRLSMWLHFVGLAAATFAYARQVGETPWGASLAAVAFPLSGFLTVHASHEWAYQTLPYLPLCLLAAERYAATGRLAWLAALAMLWGVQITIGHFQVQSWTGLLALLAGGWRVLADRRPPGRLIGLALGLAWGLAAAAVQLVPTWELAQLVGQTRRTFAELAFYSYPPAHLAELAVPGLFRGLHGGPEAPYWFTEQTTGFEACLFVGTVPLILAAVGLVAGGRGLTPWRLAVPASLALATMPRWWPEGYALVLKLPGLGYFRCPARYTAVTSLGLALLAGRGLDRAVPAFRFRAGLVLAVLFAAGSFAWALALPLTRPAFRPCLDDAGLAARLGLAALTWAAGFGAVAAWRRGALGPWAPLLLTAAEMGAFFYLGGTTDWGWSVRLPEASPVLSRLVREPGAVRVGGVLDNLPVRAGLTTATPYTGFPLPLPYPVLKAVQERRATADPAAVRWLRRYGVTHLVSDTPSAEAAGPVDFRGPDPALDRLAYRPPGLPERRTWRLIQLLSPFPEARAALRPVTAPDRSALLDALSRSLAPDEAWYLPGDAPSAPRTPAARSARVVRWDGLSGAVEHDGSCDLVLTRAHYPGWLARVDSGPERPASRADGGLLAVRLDGSGVSRVSFRFRPNGLALSAAVSSAAVASGLAVLAWGLTRSPGRPAPR